MNWAVFLMCSSMARSSKGPRGASTALQIKSGERYPALQSQVNSTSQPVPGARRLATRASGHHQGGQ